MVKTRAAPSGSSRAATTAVATRASVDEVKGSINLRIESGTRRLIDDAAAALGKTRTEFMIECARRQALDVLLDQRLFTLNSERYGAFMQALDHPPAPGPKLVSLLRRTPAWRK
ncbi:MAG: DUF1778 domain-containing protein [Methylobacteriaceae bacterium]|nr:DUF1778 domain-containing protein [Methylobacteriaceae bacterium]